MNHTNSNSSKHLQHQILSKYPSINNSGTSNREHSPAFERNNSSSTNTTTDTLFNDIDLLNNIAPIVNLTGYLNSTTNLSSSPSSSSSSQSSRRYKKAYTNNNINSNFPVNSKDCFSYQVKPEPSCYKNNIRSNSITNSNALNGNQSPASGSTPPLEAAQSSSSSVSSSFSSSSNKCILPANSTTVPNGLSSSQSNSPETLALTAEESGRSEFVDELNLLNLQDINGVFNNNLFGVNMNIFNQIDFNIENK